VTQDNAIQANCAAHLAREEFVHRGDRARRFIERDALDAVHGKEDGRQAHALAIGLIELPDEMIKRIQVDAAQRDSGRIDGQQFPPHFFFGRMQTDHDDGMWVHG